MRARVDLSGSPPRVEFPRPYNAAADLLERHLPAGGGRVAFRDDRGEMTYAALAERANRAGNALLTLGVQPEQRVLMLMLDTVNFPAVFLGAMKAGIVPVPVNTLLTPADYAHLLVNSRASALVVSDALLAKAADGIARAPDLRHVVVADSPLRGEADSPLGGDTGGRPRLGDLLAGAPAVLEPAPTTPDDVAFWLYSSGSTGPSKGTIHLHSHLVQTAVLYGAGILGVRDDDVMFSAAKLFFAYGLGNSMTVPLFAGAQSVLMAERPTPASVMRRFADHQPTIFYGVPTLFASLLADPAVTREAGSRRLRVCVSAGEALPRHVGERWRERFGCDILDGIGSTEMLHIFLSNRHGDVRYGTSGKPVPGYQFEIRGDDGRPVAAGEEGALWVSGPSAAVAYWNQRERSLANFHGPWTRTGDRYVRDADGYYTYSGRADDMLKVSGMWVSPFEVEASLSEHEAVLEAAVVGASDADGLIKPKAFVVLKDPDPARATPALVDELKRFVKDRLAPYKYPRWIEFIVELPKTATGKIQRFRLRGR